MAISSSPNYLQPWGSFATYPHVFCVPLTWHLPPLSGPVGLWVWDPWTPLCNTFPQIMLLLLWKKPWFFWAAITSSGVQQQNYLCPSNSFIPKYKTPVCQPCGGFWGHSRDRIEVSLLSQEWYWVSNACSHQGFEKRTLGCHRHEWLEGKFGQCFNKVKQEK